MRFGAEVVGSASETIMTTEISLPLGYATLEQGKIDRPETATAAKTYLVDPHQTTDGRTDPRVGDLDLAIDRNLRACDVGVLRVEEPDHSASRDAPPVGFVPRRTGRNLVYQRAVFSSAATLLLAERASASILSAAIVRESKISYFERRHVSP